MEQGSVNSSIKVLDILWGLTVEKMENWFKNGSFINWLKSLTELYVPSKFVIFPGEKSNKTANLASTVRNCQLRPFGI